MHLANVRGRPHKQGRRGTWAVGAKVMPPLNAVALEILRHEFLFTGRVGEKLSGGGRLGIADQVKHLQGGNKIGTIVDKRCQ